MVRGRVTSLLESLSFFLFSFTPPHSPISPISPWWIVFPRTALGPDIPLSYLYLHPSHTHVHTHACTHTSTDTQMQGSRMYALTYTFHWIRTHSNSLTRAHTCTHAHTFFQCWWALSRFFASPAATPVNFKLLSIDLSLFLPPRLPFSLCVVFSPSLYIYLTPIAFSGNSKPDR